jgi:hypothetical protein
MPDLATMAAEGVVFHAEDTTYLRFLITKGLRILELGARCWRHAGGISQRTA